MDARIRLSTNRAWGKMHSPGMQQTACAGRPGAL